MRWGVCVCGCSLPSRKLFAFSDSVGPVTEPKVYIRRIDTQVSQRNTKDPWLRLTTHTDHWKSASIWRFRVGCPAGQIQARAAQPDKLPQTTVKQSAMSVLGCNQNIQRLRGQDSRTRGASVNGWRFLAVTWSTLLIGSSQWSETRSALHARRDSTVSVRF